MAFETLNPLKWACPEWAIVGGAVLGLVILILGIALIVARRKRGGGYEQLSQDVPIERTDVPFGTSAYSQSATPPRQQIYGQAPQQKVSPDYGWIQQPRGSSKYGVLPTGSGVTPGYGVAPPFRDVYEQVPPLGQGVYGNIPRGQRSQYESTQAPFN